MTINNKYNIGDIVYLVTDNEQLKRIVTGIHIAGTGLMYELSLGSTSQKYYDIELRDTIDYIIKTT